MSESVLQRFTEREKLLYAQTHRLWKLCWTKARGAREGGSIGCHVLPVQRKPFNKAAGLTSHEPSCLVLMALKQEFPVRNGKVVSADVC